MTLRAVLLRLALCGSLIWPAVAVAQILPDLLDPTAEETADPPASEEPEAAEDAGGDDPAADEPDAPPDATEQDVLSALPVGDFGDADVWEALALRAEDLVRQDMSSGFAVARVRAELVNWRDHFSAQSGVNGSRIDTVTAQIAALGAVPDSGEEPATIAARRAALESQRAELSAPRVLAQEAFARANGLIGELDNQVRQQQTEALFERGPSPLNPVLFPAAIAAMFEVVGGLGSETLTGLQGQISNGRLQGNLPRALIFVGVAVLLVGFVRTWLVQLRLRLSHRSSKLLPVWLFLLSLLQLAVSYAGLLALSRGLDTLAIFGLRGSAVIAMIPAAGMTVVIGWWLGRQVFIDGTLPRHLGYSETVRRRARNFTQAIAWVLAIGVLFTAATGPVDLETGVAAAIAWPALALLGVLLWRLGRLIKTKPEPVSDQQTEPLGRTRNIIGRLCTLVAVLGPLVSALGFDSAGRAVLTSSILSLALIGAILVLQRIVQDVSTNPADDSENKGLSALLPVIISFFIYLASLPVFALVWGARTDDILEVWSRFREGLSLGETRISPTDFITFALVFALGYMLTRFIQGTLRRTVLPRTRLDLGGQNAVVSGFGYIGVMLATLIAITSAGIDLSSLAIVAGALSVGIGFGLQNIVSNFVSGIILLIERPISEGDWIEVGGQMGYVRAISVRSTRIETFDRTDVIVPNADLVSGQVTNWTRGNLVGRVIVPVGVAYGTDTEKVTEILRGIAEAHPMVLLTPPPAILFIGFGADSLDFEIRAILRDVNFVLSTRSEMNHEIAKQFADAGIEIPYAQRDVWLRNPEVLKGAVDDTTPVS